MATTEAEAVPLTPSFTAAVSVQGLTKRYGDITAVDGLSFQVEAGTVFGLLGPNGAGKSTAIKMLTTLAEPDAGTAIVAGYDVLRDTVAVRRRIGVVAQKSAVDINLSGRENLILMGRIFGLRGRGLETRVDELVARFSLGEYADRSPYKYSGGMLRKLAVAMGLVHRPEVLFLDEPTAGLDPEARASMWEEIDRLAGDENLTVLLTTHYLEEADRLAQRLAIIDRGRLISEGTPDELKGELHGDAVRLGLAEVVAEELVQAAIQRAGGVNEVTITGQTVHARVNDSAAAMPALLNAFALEGLTVATATLARPSLDDVYLRHTGRTFGDADTEGAKTEKKTEWGGQ